MRSEDGALEGETIQFTRRVAQSVVDFRTRDSSRQTRHYVISFLNGGKFFSIRCSCARFDDTSSSSRRGGNRLAFTGWNRTGEISEKETLTCYAFANGLSLFRAFGDSISVYERRSPRVGHSRQKVL